MTSYFPAQKSSCPMRHREGSAPLATALPWERRPRRRRPTRRSLGIGVRSRQSQPQVDQVVTNDPETNPALHACIPFVAAAVQTVAPLQHADATFAAGSPSLGLFEPALPLLLLPLGTLRATVGHRHACDTEVLGRRLDRGRVEAGGGRHQARNPPRAFLMHHDRRHPPLTIAGPLRVHLIRRDDLLLRFLDLHQLAELGGLARLALADDLRARLKEADQLAGRRGGAAPAPRRWAPGH